MHRQGRHGKDPAKAVCVVLFLWLFRRTRLMEYGIPYFRNRAAHKDKPCVLDMAPVDVAVEQRQLLLEINARVIGVEHQEQCFRCLVYPIKFRAAEGVAAVRAPGSKGRDINSLFGNFVYRILENISPR